MPVATTVLRRTQFVLVLHPVEDLLPAANVTVEDSSKKGEGHYTRSMADSCKRIQRRKGRGWEQDTDTAEGCD